MKQRTSKPRQACPHCGEFARIRYSEQVTPVFREGVLECQNIECGWRGKFAFQLIATMSPSQRPNPRISLPISPRIKQALLAQLLSEAN